jgi:toxin-antitoxin system PIN domain toxin
VDVLDVNILLNAHRVEQPQHQAIRAWLDNLIGEGGAFGVPSLVFSAFLRISTNPRAFVTPTPPQLALEAVEAWRTQPGCILLEPGARHWSVFTELLARVGARGNVVPDVYLAAIAIENGGDFVSTDRGFGRLPGLRWRHPLEP